MKKKDNENKLPIELTIGKKKMALSEILKDETPEFKKSIDGVLAVKASADQMGTDLMKINITDDNNLSIAQQNLSKANNVAKAIEEKRKEIKEPYLHRSKIIDGLAELINEQLSVGIQHVKNQIVAYDNKKQEDIRKQQEALANEQLEREKSNGEEKKQLDYVGAMSKWAKECFDKCVTIDKCENFKNVLNTQWPPDEKFGKFLEQSNSIRQQYLDLLEARMGSLNAQNAISEELTKIALEKEQIAIQKAGLAEKERNLILREEAEKQRILDEEADRLVREQTANLEITAEAEKTGGIRSHWKFELVDKDKLISDWMTMDEAAVKEYLKANKDAIKDGAIINGVKFFKEKTAVAG